MEPDDKLKQLAEFLEEQRQKLLATIDWGQDSDYEFSPEFMLGNDEDL